MNRLLTAVFSALEGVLVVGIGLGIPLVPLTLLWALEFDLRIEWIQFYRVSGVSWLLGHGVDMNVRLGSAVAESLALPAAATPFPVTIAILGFALVTVLAGVRAGRRIGQTGHLLLGGACAVAAVALLSAGISVTSRTEVTAFPLWQGVLLPTLTFALGGAIGWLLDASTGRLVGPNLIVEWISDLPERVRLVLGSALRGGAAAAAMIVAAAAVGLGGLLAGSYATVVTLYESLQAGALGGGVLTIAQLALLPNLVVWAASWLIGPGFSIGSGSAVNPLGSQLGPIPSLPVFGALPPTELSFGFLSLLVPVLAGFLCGLLVARPLSSPASGQLRTAPGLPELSAVGVGTGVAAGAILGVLALAAGGSAGPGRLADVGPDALLVGLCAAVEVGGGALLGMAGALRGRRPQAPG